MLLSADRDEFFNRASVTALYEALGASTELLQFPGSHGNWQHPGRRYRSMFDFFRTHLGGAQCMSCERSGFGS